MPARLRPASHGFPSLPQNTTHIISPFAFTPMKLSLSTLLAIALCGGFTHALAQGFDKAAIEKMRESHQAPGSAEADSGNSMLSVNYRIAITATENGTRLGELAALTCTSAFQLNGGVNKRSNDDPLGATLSVNGALAEQEGGTLKLSYSVIIHTAVPSQTISAPGGGPSLTTTHSFKRTGASGMLLLKPGQSYEVLTTSGTVYAISITPTDTPPAPKPQPGAKPREGASTQPAEDRSSANKSPSGESRNAQHEEDRKRFENLSESAKDKFRHAMSEVLRDEKFRTAPEEERRAKIKEVFEKTVAEDKAQPGKKADDAHAAGTQPAPGSLPENKGPSRESRSKGPTDEDRRRYESLSDKAKEKFRDSMRETFADEKFRNAPEEERRAKIRQLYEKAETEDKAGKK
jgi:hypothetical protein